MNKREKILAGLVLLLLVVWGGSTAVDRYQSTVSQRRNRLFTAEEARDKVRFEAKERGPAAMKQIDAWQKQSLPDDRQAARGLYLEWLMEQLEESGLEGDIELESNSPSTDAFASLGYRLEGKGKLDAVTKFLYAFYRSDQLHKITQLRLRPLPESDELNVTIKLEALLVKGSTQEDTLSTGEREGLALESVEAYVAALDGRNVFQVAKVGGDVANDDSQSAAQQTRLTSIQGGQKPQAWLTNNSTGKILSLHEGDTIELDGFSGRVERIGRLDVVVAQADSQLLVKIGQTLAEGVRQPNADRGQAVEEAQLKAEET